MILTDSNFVTVKTLPKGFSLTERTLGGIIYRATQWYDFYQFATASEMAAFIAISEKIEAERILSIAKAQEETDRLLKSARDYHAEQRAKGLVLRSFETGDFETGLTFLPNKGFYNKPIYKNWYCFKNGEKSHVSIF